MRSLGFFTAALLSTAAFGQNGSIAGTILATDGGAISNATVTAKNAAGTGVSAKSNSKGGYSIASVAPGTYDVTVELPPLFMTYTKKDVRVEAGKAARLDVELEDVNLNTLGDGASGFAYLSADKPAPKGPAPRTRDGKPDL